MDSKAPKTGPNQMIYCPYTNRKLNESEISPEHIIPLSLGGNNNFTVPVSKIFNSDIGSKIDGALANDFFVLSRRSQLDVRGHSRKRPKLVLKKSRDSNTGEPLQILLDKQSGLKIWSPKTKEYFTGGTKFESSISINPNSSIRFTAKVALSAGYYIYGDLFRNNVEHEEIRFIMNHDVFGADENTKIQAMKIRTLIDDRLYRERNTGIVIYQEICSAFDNSSILGFEPCEGDMMIFFVGILGSYIGFLNIPTHTSSFPIEGHHDLGHIIILKNNDVIRMSFRNACKILAKQLSITISDDAK